MSAVNTPIPDAVRGTYASFSKEQREKLLVLRELILEVAEATDGVGEIEECLKWGQPSFVTRKPKSGSTVRIDALKNDPSKVAVYFICNTKLVDRFRERYPDVFTFEGNRALIFDVKKPLPESELRHCVAMALTYHLKY